MTFSRVNVENLTKELFPNHNLDLILSILEEYGIEEYECEKERVHIAVLKLSNGDKNKLLDMVTIAKRDYRDVLLWAESPPRNSEQISAEQAIVDDLVNRFGK